MTKVLLSVHVLAAILAIGPIAVAASVFPAACARRNRATGRPRSCTASAAVTRSSAPPSRPSGSRRARRWGAHRRVADRVDHPDRHRRRAARAGDPARQRKLLALAPGGDVPASAVARLAGLTGTFNLLWAIVVVLMIVRPGSTTGA